MTKVDALVVDRPGYGAVESSCHADMVWIPGGTFHMGSDRHYAEESPVHRVVVDGFWIDRTPVTNRQFRRFVASTGHITFAEIAPDPKASVASGHLNEPCGIPLRGSSGNVAMSNLN